MNERKGIRRWGLWCMVGVLLLSAALVWHDLGTREVLGRDENLSITQLDQPNLIASIEAALLKATGQPSNMQPLYFPLQRIFWPLVGRSAFVLRFLPSLFAVLAVAFTYKLGQVLFDPGAGLVGAFLTALLPLHIRYGQIARPYTLLALLSLASAYFLIRALQTNRPIHWAGFVLTATLNFYTHFNALFALVAEGIFVGLVWLTMLIAVLRKRQSSNRLVGPVIGFLLVGILCLPGLIRLAQLPWVGTRGEVQVQLTFVFFQRLLDKFGLTATWLRGLLLGFLGFGLLATLYRRRWQAALFAVLWLAVPFLILSVMKSPRPFAERYVIFVPPVALLLTGEGVITMGQVLSDLTRQSGLFRTQKEAAALRWAVTIGLTAGLALLFISPLRAYYAANRSDDRMELTVEIVERHAQPGDLIIISPRFFVQPLDANGAKVLYLTEHLTLSEFNELISRHERTWILYTSYLPPVKLQEPMDRWIQARSEDFVRVPIKALNALAYHNHTLTDPEALLRDRIGILQDLALASDGKQEAWLRYSVLADAYESLSKLYEARGEPTLAESHRQKAEEIRATAPRP